MDWLIYKKCGSIKIKFSKIGGAERIVDRLILVHENKNLKNRRSGADRGSANFWSIKIKISKIGGAERIVDQLIFGP